MANRYTLHHFLNIVRSVLYALAISLLPQNAYSQADFITHTFLTQSLWTDHVLVFEKIFRVQKIGNFLEFGLGYGTKYFLDHCERVSSFEIVVQKPHAAPHAYYEWFEKCKALYEQYDNWSPKLHKATGAIEAAQQEIWRTNVPPQNTAYRDALAQLVENVCPINAYDLVFVDPGIQLRGEIVQALFNRTPIIVAHDTNDLTAYYGWNTINTPDNYVQLHFPHGSGTTVWIQRSYQKLITELQK